MRQVRYGMLVLCAGVTMAWLAADSSVAWAAQDSDRTEHWEFTFPVRFVNGQTVHFEEGTNIEIDDDLGWGVGFGYNLDERLNLNFEFSWMSANYQVNWASADTPGVTASATGTLDVGSSMINLNYNIMPKTITPYISGGVGWNWVDTNIPTGPPGTGCWWDPWFGYICTTYQDTATESGFVYGLGAGVRIEPKPTLFFRLGLNNNWQDYGSHADDPDFLSYRFELGWKF